MDNVKRIINFLTKESEITKKLRNKPTAVIPPRRYYVKKEGERDFNVCDIAECESYSVTVYPYAPYSRISQHIIAHKVTLDKKMASVLANITVDNTVIDMDTFTPDLYPTPTATEKRVFKTRYDIINNSVKGFFEYIIKYIREQEQDPITDPSAADDYVMYDGIIRPDNRDFTKENETLDKAAKGEINMKGKDSGFITDEREFYKSEGFSVGFFLSCNFVPCIEASEEFVNKIRKIKYEFMGAINIKFKTPAFFDGKADFDYTTNDGPRYKDIPKEASEFLDVCFTKYNLIRPINRGKIPSSGDVICVNNRGTRRFFLITTFGFVELKMFA